jgi:uncharacterized membrane protein
MTLLAGTLVLVLSACSRQPRYPAPPQRGSDIVIDVATIENEVPKYFTYRHRDRNINFFVLKFPDRVLSFLDACITCYPQKLGYRHEQGYVTCRACGTRYSVYKLETGLGGCYPIRITGRLDKGDYIIPLAELASHAGKF